MDVCYNKLFKLLIDKSMLKTEFDRPRKDCPENQSAYLGSDACALAG